MTRNIKKLLVLVLVLAMSGSMMIVAWADGDPPSETAEIEFTGWADPDGPHPPEGEDELPGVPDNELPEYPIAPPGGDNVDYLAGSGLQFWTHDITDLPATGALRFHSVRNLNVASTGTFAQGGFHATEDDPGRATTGNTSYAGMVFRFREPGWSVSVTMSEFTHDGETAIFGPELTLVRAGTPFGQFVPPNSDAIFARTLLRPGDLTPLIPATSGGGTTGTGALGMMWFGHNFSGELLLSNGLPDVLIVDHATADLTWTSTLGTP